MGGILGITGARDFPAAVRQRVLGTLLLLTADEYVTGAAVGVDTFVGAQLVRLYPQARHRVIVPADRTQVVAWWRCGARPAHFDVEFMPDGSSYRQRNLAIVERVTELLAYPLYRESDPRSRRSGTWQTVRMARQTGVPVSVVILSGLAGGGVA